MVLPWNKYRKDLFSGVSYAVLNTTQHAVRERVGELLEAGGAHHCPARVQVDQVELLHLPLKGLQLNKLTHLITDTIAFPEYEQLLKENVTIVSLMWPVRMWDLQAYQDPVFYSPDPAKVFSGVCISTAGLPGRDEEHIAALVGTYGGQYRPLVTKEVTHLICIKPSGTKYEQVMTNGAALGMKAVLPQWFFDSLHMLTLQPTGPYEFPHPPLLEVNGNGLPPASKMSRNVNVNTATSLVVDPSRANSSATAYLYSSCQENREKVFKEIAPKITPSYIFNGLKVYLASSLELGDQTVALLKRKIKDAGGTIFVARVPKLKPSDPGFTVFEQEQQLIQSDYIICPRRSGWEYWRALDLDKNIGNFAWLIYVLMEGKLDPPMDHIMHYPPPATPIPGFTGYAMTITNYVGQSRDLLKRMIEVMGGSVRGDMNKATSHVIAASRSGKKVESAVDWNIPVLNHTWLNECFARWDNINPANLQRTTNFPPGVNYMHLLTHHKLAKQGISGWANTPPALEDRTRSLADLESTKAKSQAVEPTTEGSTEEEEQDELVQEDVPMPLASRSSGTPEEDAPISLDAQIADDLIPKSSLKGAASSPAVLQDTTQNRKEPKGRKAANAKAAAAKKPRASSAEPFASPAQAAKKPPSKSQKTPVATSEVDRSNAGRSRRQAAESANAKVSAAAHDMLEHEKEKKRKRPSEVAAPAEESEEESSKRRRSSRAGATETEAAVSKRGSAKKSQASVAVDLSDDEDELESDEPERTAKPRSKGKSTPSTASKKRKATTTATGICVMTTGIDLSPSDITKMKKLGIQLTEDPTLCTHVVSKGIQRTEKFLCAMPRQPFYVTQKWLTDCIKDGVVREEDGYELSDKANEKKYNFSFDNALRQAGHAALFKGITFYITRSTQPGMDKLKRIVEVNGGKITLDIPTANILSKSPRKHVLISCKQDKAIWSKFTSQNIVIYGPELIPLSAIRQELAFDDKASLMVK